MIVLGWRGKRLRKNKRWQKTIQKKKLKKKAEGWAVKPNQNNMAMLRSYGIGTGYTSKGITGAKTIFSKDERIYAIHVWDGVKRGDKFSISWQRKINNVYVEQKKHNWINSAGYTNIYHWTWIKGYSAGDWQVQFLINDDIFRTKSFTIKAKPVAPEPPAPPTILPIETTGFWRNKGYSFLDAVKIVEWVKKNRMTPTPATIEKEILKLPFGILPEQTIGFWTLKGYSLEEAGKIAGWVIANKMTPSPSKIKEIIAVQKYKVLPKPPITIHDEGLVWYKKFDDALDKKDKKGIMKLLLDALYIHQSPMPLLAIVMGIAGIVATIVAIVGSYAFAGFIREETLQTIDFAIRSAEQNNDVEALEKAIALKEEVLDRTLWEKILGAIPVVTVMEALSEYKDAAVLKLETDKGTLERMRGEMGLTVLPEVVKTYVRDIIDGDTIDVSLEIKDSLKKLPKYQNTNHARVRLIGINAPEKSPKGEILCTGIEIYQVEKKYADLSRDVLLPLNDREVTLYIDPEHRFDGYGRILARVDYNNEDLGLKQIQRGYACHYFREKNKYIDDEIYKAETLRAKEEGVGMWAEVPEDLLPPGEEVILFTIASTPDRAKVTIDNIYTHHLTPTNEEEQKDVIHVWTLGKHILRLEKSGYAHEEEIELIAGQRLNIDWVLGGMVVGEEINGDEEIPTPPDEISPPAVIQSMPLELSTSQRTALTSALDEIWVLTEGSAQISHEEYDLLMKRYKDYSDEDKIVLFNLWNDTWDLIKGSLQMNKAEYEELKVKYLGVSAPITPTIPPEEDPRDDIIRNLQDTIKTLNETIKNLNIKLGELTGTPE